MALDQDTSRAKCLTPRTKTIPARGNVVFYKGAIVVKRRGSKLAEIPLAASPRTDLIPIGVCQYPLDTTGLADGARVDCTSRRGSVRRSGSVQRTPLSRTLPDRTTSEKRRTIAVERW